MLVHKFIDTKIVRLGISELLMYEIVFSNQSNYYFSAFSLGIWLKMPSFYVTEASSSLVERHSLSRSKRPKNGSKFCLMGGACSLCVHVDWMLGELN